MPSSIVEAKTRPLPLGVLNITATTNRPKSIVIKWQKSTQDIDFYRVYRADKETGKYKAIVKLYETEFIDKIQEDGKEYFYKISVVDKYGLESLKSIVVVGSTLTKPAIPHFTKVSIEGNSAVTTWLANDSRTQSFILTKIVHKGWSNNRQEFQLNQKMYKDSDIIQGTKYSYTIQAVDEFGLKSKPSNEAEITFPKGSATSTSQGN
jgi:fibronectin type 3 domain-containing protein